MSRTINRPSTNITPPTSAHPTAATYGVKVARAVTRQARHLTDMLNGSIEAQRVDVRDRRVLAAAGLTVQLGPCLRLTDAGVLLAEAVKNAS